MLREAAGAKVALVATGSEVKLAVAAADLLAAEGVPARVVSMPCTERFEAQDAAWRDAVLPPSLPVVTVEAGATRGWYKYAGRSGACIGIDRFGESAPEKALYDYFGLTAEKVAAAAKAVAG